MAKDKKKKKSGKVTVNNTVKQPNPNSVGGASNPSERNTTKQMEVSEKVKRGFLEGLMYRVGYIKKDTVSSFSDYLKEEFVKDEEGKSIVSENIEKKFEKFRENIKTLLAGGVIVKLGYVNSKTVSSLFDDVNKEVNELLNVIKIDSESQQGKELSKNEIMNNDAFDGKSLEEQLGILKKKIDILIEKCKTPKDETNKTGGAPEGVKGNTGDALENENTNTDGTPNEVINNGITPEGGSGDVGSLSEYNPDNTGDAFGDETPDANDAPKDETGEGGGASSEVTERTDDAEEEKVGESNVKDNQDKEKELENLRKELERLQEVEADNASKQEQINQLERQLQGRRSKEEWETLCNENEQLYESLDKYKKIKAAVDGKLFRMEIKLERLDLYEKKIEELNQEKNKLKQNNINLQSNYASLQEENGRLKESISQLDNNYNECNARVQELEGSDVGELRKTIEEKESIIDELTSAKETAEANLKSVESAKAEVDSELRQTKEDLRKANDTISEKLEELTAKNKEIIINKKTIENKDKVIDSLTDQSKRDNAKIEEQKNDLEARQNTINEKETEIRQLETNNSSLNGQVNSLTTKVSNLEKDKENLTKAKEAEEKKTQKKIDFINAERDAFAKSIITLAENLSKASEKDFLGCCDEAFEGNRVSLQEKVAKPIRAFVRELADIDSKKYVSQKALEDAYHALVKENMDSSSGLTRIAQWYAYSCIPFMVDEDRSDGLFVRQAEIRTMYSLATRLLGMVGVEYRMPILYAEHISDNNMYDDVTGKRQLNIEYMCPTARSHKENIDCIDNSSVIIDVVEVGYCDNRGNNKNPQVII